VIIPTFDHDTQFINQSFIVKIPHMTLVDVRGVEVGNLYPLVSFTSVRVSDGGLLLSGLAGIVKYMHGVRRRIIEKATFSDVAEDESRYYAVGPGIVRVWFKETGVVDLYLNSWAFMSLGGTYGNYLVSCDDIRNVVVVLDRSTRSLVTTIETVDIPVDVAFDGTYFYVVEAYYIVRKYDINGNLVGEYDISANNIEYGGGYIYVTRTNGLNIYVYDTDMNLIKVLKPNINYVIHSIAVDDSGNIIATTGDGYIHKIDADGNVLLSKYIGGMNFVFYADGYVLVADIVNDVVKVYDSNLNDIIVLDHPYIRFPLFASWDGTYFLVFSHYYAALLRFDSSGNYIGATAGYRFNSVDAGKGVFVAAYGSVVCMWDLSGKLKVCYSLVLPMSVFFRGDDLYIYDYYYNALYVSKPPYTSISKYADLPNGPYRFVRYSHGRYVAVDANGEYVYLLDDNMNEVFRYGYTVTDDVERIMKADYDGRYVYVARMSRIDVVDVNTGESATLLISPIYFTNFMSLSKTGVIAYAPTPHNMHLIYDVSGVTSTDIFASYINYAPNGNIIITDSTTNKIYLFDGKELTLLHEAGVDIASSVLLSDGTIIASIATNGKVLLVKGGAETVIDVPFRVRELGVHMPDFSKAYLIADDGVYEMYSDGSYSKISDDINVLAYGVLKDGTVYKITGGGAYVGTVKVPNVMPYYNILVPENLPWGKRSDRAI